MKNLTKVLSIVMVLVMALSFASCGSSETPAPIEAPVASPNTPDTPDTPAPEVAAPAESGAKDTVVAFMDALVKLDSAVMAENMVGGVMPEGMEEMDMQKIVEPLAQESGMPLDDFTGIMYKIMAEAIKYEVKSVEENGDTAVANITLMVKDTTALSEIDYDAVMADMDMEAKVMELLESGKLSENSSEEEVMAVVMEMVMPVLEEAMLNALKDAEYEPQDITFTLVKDNGAWKIKDDASIGSAGVSDVLGNLSF